MTKERDAARADVLKLREVLADVRDYVDMAKLALKAIDERTGMG